MTIVNQEELNEQAREILAEGRRPRGEVCPPRPQGHDPAVIIRGIELKRERRKTKTEWGINLRYYLYDPKAEAVKLPDEALARLDGVVRDAAKELGLVVAGGASHASYVEGKYLAREELGKRIGKSVRVGLRTKVEKSETRTAVS